MYCWCGHFLTDFWAKTMFQNFTFCVQNHEDLFTEIAESFKN